MDDAGAAGTTSMGERAEPRFVRDSTTYLAYLTIAYLLFIESSLGPIMPSLRAQMGMSYTVASLHFSAPAFGGMMTGWIGDKIARRIGRRRTFWLGVIGITAGAALLVTGRWIPMTIAGALFIGGFGALISIVMQAYLADEYVNHRPKVMSEFNMAASFGAVLVAFVIGAADRTGLGWRAALVIASALVALALFKMRHAPIGERMPYHVHRRGKSAPMPAVFWVCCAVAALSAATEWGFAFWGADFLHQVAGFSTASASVAMSAFFIAMVSGRYIGSRIGHRVNAIDVLMLAFVIGIAGFLLFWLAPVGLIRVGGLFLAGLGIANVYPYVASLATELAPGRADVAMAKLLWTGSLAILLSPFVLGVLGDAIGIRRGFGVLAPLLLIALVGTISLRPKITGALTSRSIGQ
jgi:MFS family permease